MGENFIPIVNEMNNGEEGNNLCLEGSNTVPDPCVNGAAPPNSCLTGTSNDSTNMCLSGTSEPIV